MGGSLPIGGGGQHALNLCDFFCAFVMEFLEISKFHPMQLVERNILSYFLGHSLVCRLFYRRKSTIFLNLVRFFSSSRFWKFV